MFDIESQAILLGGKSGPVDISDFIDLVDRNRRVDSINWYRHTSDGNLGHLCTIAVGNPELGDARNVSTPVIPEFTEFIDRKNRVGIRGRGWRMLLSIFIHDGWIYPTNEIRKWLGDPMWEKAREAGPCR